MKHLPLVHITLCPITSVVFGLGGERFQPIFENAIRDIVATPNGSLHVTFENGYEAFLPKDDSVETDSYYDHWYYREPGKA